MPDSAFIENANGIEGHAAPQVAVLFHRLGPYHHARLRAAGMKMRVTAIEFSNIDKMYEWDLLDGANGFKRVRLFSDEAVENLPSDRVLKRVKEVLNEIRPQVVAIAGWSDRCSLAALWWCTVMGIPTVVMSETTSWDFDRQWIKEMLKRQLLKLCATGLVGGRAHVEYLQKLDIAPAKIFMGYDAVDNDYFSSRAGEIKSQATALRSQHHLPENYFLASARFVPKKNLSRLIQAYADYRELSLRGNNGDCPQQPWDLVLLGDGPLRKTIEKQIISLGLAGHVLMPGFKQYEELPLYYALSNVFVHASTTEQWGLVVNEAMASGLPVLVSDRCGCALDLVVDGVTGFIFDPLDVKQLAQLMFRCSLNSTDLVALGRAGEKRVADWGVERFASGLKDAAEAALASPRPKPSWLHWLQIKLLLLHKERVST